MMAYIEELCVWALLRRLADNIQLDGLIGDAWNQIGGLVACKCRRLIIRLLGIISLISIILILIPFSFLEGCVKRIQPGLIVTE
jgi:hypothetical protein